MIRVQPPKKSKVRGKMDYIKFCTYLAEHIVITNDGTIDFWDFVKSYIENKSCKECTENIPTLFPSEYYHFVKRCLIDFCDAHKEILNIK